MAYYMEHKGLKVPWLDRNRFKLGLPYHQHGEVCIISPTSKQCKILCSRCVFEITNISTGLDYLIEQSYITKAEALAFSLDILSNKEE